RIGTLRHFPAQRNLDASHPAGAACHGRAPRLCCLFVHPARLPASAANCCCSAGHSSLRLLPRRGLVIRVASSDRPYRGRQCLRGRAKPVILPSSYHIAAMTLTSPISSTLPYSSTSTVSRSTAMASQGEKTGGSASEAWCAMPTLSCLSYLRPPRDLK